MIIRVWVIAGILIVSLAWFLTYPASPPDFQMPPSVSAIDGYRTAKLIPAAGSLRMSDEIGHEVFEIPETDAARMKEAMASANGMTGMQMDMPSMKMDMPTAKQESAKMDMPGMKMDMPTAKQESARMDMPGMKMDMPGMKMDMQAAKQDDDHGAKADAGEGGAEHGTGAPGLTILASGPAGGQGVGAASYKGARRIDLAMQEWGYSPAMLRIKTGEVVRLIVSNKGRMPHEFMLMDGAGMQAVNYRLQRADWNLTEHAAPFEIPVVMPGDKFELLLRADKPGMWMYMCMFPFHMKFGMMGMMMVSADASGSGAMKGMKMDMPGMNMK